MYPPTRDAPRTESAAFHDDTSWVSIFGPNTPVFKRPEPLPPVGSVFFFRVAGLKPQQPVYPKPDETSDQTGFRLKGEVLRVIDFKGAWVRLSPETEAEVDESWEGWMVAESVQETLLEEIEDPAEHEREFTRDLFRRIATLSAHVTARLADRSSERARQYLRAGRVPPGKKDQLPEGTRCLNAFWGLEARHVKLNPGQEYWPQGCLSLSQNYIRAGWEEPSEEARSAHWRVFAARPFEANELIEVCPLVEVDVETCIASFPLRMNIVETPSNEGLEQLPGKLSGRVKSYVPLGFGMLYQQSIELDDVKINWTPVTNYNCKFIPVKEHMYVYATRKILADEELILEYKRCFRTPQGESIDFTGFTPYWCRRQPPEAFAEALQSTSSSSGSLPGRVKFGKSQLHNRGIFADANYKKGAIIEMCPCLILDTNGADCMQDHCFHIPEVKIDVEGRSLVKRKSKYILPLGYGGIYNHLASGKGENIQWLYDETTHCFIWIADPQDGQDEILRNEELCFDYGEAYWAAPSRRQQRPTSRSTEESPSAAQ